MEQLDLFKDERSRSPTEASVEKKGNDLKEGGLTASQLALAKILKDKSIQLKFKSPPPAPES